MNRILFTATLLLCALTADSSFALTATEKRQLTPRDRASTASAPPGVGFTRSVTDDPEGGRLEYAIWYPTNAETATTRIGPYEFASTTDAAPATGQFGLVALSHGNAGTPFGHRNIAIALARAGIIAVAPLHPRDNYKDSSGVGHRVVWEGRPRQISAVIDHMLEEPKWSGLIDSTRIGAFGFSLGGYTVLSLSGARPDLGELIRHCDANDKHDPLCKRANGLADAMRQVVKEEFQQPQLDLADARICAAVVADPVAAMFTAEAIRGLTVSALRIYMPEHENELTARFHGNNVARILQNNSEISVNLQRVPKAQHYSFIAPFPERLRKRLPAAFKNHPDFDEQRFHQRFAREVAGFFTAELDNCSRSRTQN